LPLAKRAVLKLQQVPTGGQGAVFDVMAELEPESGGDAAGRSLKGTLEIDSAATQIDIHLVEERSEKTPLEFTDRAVFSKFRREIEIRRTIQKPTTSAQFVSTDRNRQMLITYKFAGFKEVARNGDVMIMENDYSAIQPVPPYVQLIVE
jgi:hypothetical protein